MHPEILKAIMDRAVRPMILYGAEIWGGRYQDQRISKALDTAQRPYLKHIARAYNTAPTAALQVITGTPPWNLEAAKKANLRQASNRGKIENHKARLQRINIEPESQERMSTNLVQTRIYTDGTKSSERVAAAMVVKTATREEHREVVLLPGYATSYQAEREAVTLALKWLAAQGEDKKEVEIICDNIPVVKQLNSQLQDNPNIAELRLQLKALWQMGKKSAGRRKV